MITNLNKATRLVARKVTLLDDAENANELYDDVEQLMSATLFHEALGRLVGMGRLKRTSAGEYLRTELGAEPLPAIWDENPDPVPGTTSPSVPDGVEVKPETPGLWHAGPDPAGSSQVWTKPKKKPKKAKAKAAKPPRAKKASKPDKASTNGAAAPATREGAWIQRVVANGSLQFQEIPPIAEPDLCLEALERLEALVASDIAEQIARARQFIESAHGQ